MQTYMGKELLELQAYRPKSDPGQAAQERARLHKDIMDMKNDDVIALKFDPGKAGITGTGAQPDVIFRDDSLKQVLEENAEYDRSRVATRLGIRLQDVKTLGWLESGDRENDVKGIRTFEVMYGDKKGEYHIAYDENGGEILKKFDGTKYANEGEARPRPKTNTEKEKKEEEVKADFDKNRGQYMRLISEGKNPLTKEAAEFDMKNKWPEGLYRARGMTQRAWDRMGNTEKQRYWLDWYMEQAMKGE